MVPVYYMVPVLWMVSLTHCEAEGLQALHMHFPLQKKLHGLKIT